MTDPLDRLVLPGGPRVMRGSDGAYRLVGATRKVDLREPGTPSGSYRITAEDLLLAAARMRRDGMSLRAIRRRLELLPHVTDGQLERSLQVGMALLERRIAAGLEPAESVHEVPVQVAEADDDL